MWPLDQPAGEVLKLAGASRISWATFDPEWYLDSYRDVIETVAGVSPAALLRYYLETGQRRGHSPNRLFDETWHRRAYPQIAEGAVAGRFASAFDAYCRRGCMDRSPHWLFDEPGYRARNPDLTPDVLFAAELANNYDHYLRHGSKEGRIGHVLFDETVYLANCPPGEIAAARQQGAFQHYLRRIESGEPELPTSIYFDPDWYLRRYPAVEHAISAGEWKSALHHYLCNDTPTDFDPHESFSEAYYLNRDPGLRDAIAARHFRNGYQHFLAFGAAELRSPAPSIDLAWYASRPTVRVEIERGLAPNTFAHWLALGRTAGLPTQRPEAELVSEAQGRTLFRRAAVTLLPLAGRFGYSFECLGEPQVSVVMVLHDGFATTLATIASLRNNIVGDIELVLIDCGSTDETQAIGDYVPGAVVLRFESDVGWPHAANAGLQLSTAAVVLFLDSAVQLAPGAVDHACVRLLSDVSVGAVGGMIVQPDGTIGQAGGIIWKDGGTHNYRRGDSPLSPEVNFLRSVDFCSAAFLIVRAALLTQLDGFDHQCTPAEMADVDLCIRINKAGFKVIYDPAVVLFHDDGDVRKVRASGHFLRKHESFLTECFAPAGRVQVFARHTGVSPPRLLFIEDTVPIRRTGSGFVRSNDLVKVIASLGYQVTVFPVNGCTQNAARIFRDLPDTVEVMHDRAVERFGELLASRVGYYSVVWIARTHNLDRIRQHLTRIVDAKNPRPLIVLDTEAVAPLREAAYARLVGKLYDLDASMRAAFINADICDAVIAVTDNEAKHLEAMGLRNISVIGHMIEPRPTLQSHSRRTGMLFVGAIHTIDSPNLDSLIWFVDRVLPLVEAALGWECRLTIAGYTASGIDLGRFADHPRITLRGTVADLGPLYDSHRVFVAPTRFAAGLPYKIFEAASSGLPIVATDLLCEQVGWARGEEILSADVDDPEAFAAAVIALYRDEGLWLRIREAAMGRLRRENGRRAYAEEVGRVLGRA